MLYIRYIILSYFMLFYSVFLLQVSFVCLDNLSEGSNLKNLEPIASAPNFVFVKGDVLSHKTLRHALVSHNVDTVMHFAAGA